MNQNNAVTLLETREIWAQILKGLRENDEQVLLSAVSNLQIIFTRDSITIVASNKAVFELLKKYKTKFDNYAGNKCQIIIKEKSDKAQALPLLEQKLAKIFCEKLIVDVQ